MRSLAAILALVVLLGWFAKLGTLIPAATFGVVLWLALAFHLIFLRTLC